MQPSKQPGIANNQIPRRWRDPDVHALFETRAVERVLDVREQRRFEKPRKPHSTLEREPLPGRANAIFVDRHVEAPGLDDGNPVRPEPVAPRSGSERR